MPEFTLVQQPASVCAELPEQEPVGVDTEFMREDTFFAQLCLVQLATADSIYCVDPLAAAPLDDFWGCFVERHWVLHSARQDIEVICQTAGLMPTRIFDTQIAAGLLGMPPQLGYAGLVRELFGVEIPKSHTRANWARRPLSDELLHYAAEDVEYLLPAYAKLREELERHDRLAWAEEDSAQLLDPALYSFAPEAAVDRLKGAKNLRGRRRTAAARLAAWREADAMRVNRPRQWIVRDPVLIELASRLPQTIDDLHAVDGLPAGLIRRAGKQLLRVIAATADDDHDYRPPPAPTEAQKAAIKTMQAAVAACATDLGVTAEVLAPKRDLVGLVVRGHQHSRLMRGWRREVIGERLLELL